MDPDDPKYDDMSDVMAFVWSGGHEKLFPTHLDEGLIVDVIEEFKRKRNQTTSK